MKKEIHPKEYRPVVFIDNSNGSQFLISSTIASKEKVKWSDGKEYPAVHVEISSTSHPFYTNQEKSLDSAGRVEKFKTRQSKATQQSRPGDNTQSRPGDNTQSRPGDNTQSRPGDKTKKK